MTAVIKEAGPSASAPPVAKPGGAHVNVPANDGIVRGVKGKYDTLKAGAAAKPADSSAALLALLKVEADARNVASERDLTFFIANETRKLTRARQIFVLRPGLSAGLEVVSVSSLASVDRNAPLVALIEKVVANAAAVDGLAAVSTLTLPSDDSIAKAYPFRSLFWVPLKHRDDEAVGGLVLAREDDWLESDMVVAKRLAATYAHALKALRTPARQRVRQWIKPNKWHAAVSAAALVSLFLIKVPLTALAPVEIVARNPFIVTAPMDAVIERVVVDINQPVMPGALLIEFADTTLRNKAEVAEREVEVSTARLKQVNQLAFTDPKGMHDLKIARAELELKIAERDFARDLLSKAQIRAPRHGVAIYSDKRELTGKPVAVGERILEIAEPARVEARISLPIGDAIALQSGARVKLYLDSDPLHPWEAIVTRADYKARVTENDVVSYRVIASIDPREGKGTLPRLGNRGTAQVFGDDVTLAFYLFRRPLTALRQWFGV